MKTPSCLLAIGVATLLATQLTTQAQKPHVRIEVQRKISSDSETKRSGSKTSRTSETTKERIQTLKVVVKNADLTPQSVVVYSFFYADTKGVSAPPYVYDQKAVLYELVPNETVTFDVEAPPLVEKIKQGTKSSSRKGDKPVGYLVIAEVGTNLVAAIASSHAFEKIAADPAALQEVKSRVTAPTTPEPKDAPAAADAKDVKPAGEKAPDEKAKH